MPVMSVPGSRGLTTVGASHLRKRYKIASIQLRTTEELHTKDSRILRGTRTRRRGEKVKGRYDQDSSYSYRKLADFYKINRIKGS